MHWTSDRSAKRLWEPAVTDSGHRHTHTVTEINKVDGDHETTQENLLYQVLQTDNALVLDMSAKSPREPASTDRVEKPEGPLTHTDTEVTVIHVTAQENLLHQVLQTDNALVCDMSAKSPQEPASTDRVEKPEGPLTHTDIEVTVIHVTAHENLLYRVLQTDSALVRHMSAKSPQEPASTDRVEKTENLLRHTDTEVTVKHVTAQENLLHQVIQTDNAVEHHMSAKSPREPPVIDRAQKPEIRLKHTDTEVNEVHGDHVATQENLLHQV